MKRAYIITDFDLKTDIQMKYIFKNRNINFTKEDLIYDLQYYLEGIHREYQEITNTNISYDDFYNKFKVNIKVSCISMQYKNIITKEDYEKYLEEIKIIDKNKLKEYLLDCVSNCEFYLDHNLNLKETYSNILNDLNFNNYYTQFSFSYKALYPEKYHVEKFKIGDSVKYKGKKYSIINIIKYSESIYKYTNPLEYRYGYILTDGDEYIPDDKFGYYPVDEDLEEVKL